MNKICEGDRFGNLVIVKEVSKEERPNPKAGRYYLCQCDCGNTKVIYGHNLKTGNTKSCGCLSRKTSSENNSIQIPIGSVFGKLTVVGRATVRPGGNAYWRCQCECGRETEVAGRDLRAGSTTSCGCKKLSRLIDETNNKYGLLTVLEYAGTSSGGGAQWKCICDCGNIVTVRAESLRSGHSKSCGCIKSWAEQKITALLREYEISFATQFTFPDLRTDRGGTPRFDYAIFKNNTLYCLIEYNGEQHYNPTSSWYSDEYKERDELKRRYCDSKNIPLLTWNKNSNIEEEVASLKKQISRQDQD